MIGLDSDNKPRLAIGEVGKVGVAIDSIDDMMRLFDGINMEKSVYLDDPQRFGRPFLLALYIVTARRTGRERSLAPVGDNSERCAEGIRHPAEPTFYTLAQAMRIITDIFSLRERKRARVEHHLHLRHVTCATQARHPGQGWPSRNGMTYVQAAIDAGLDVDKFAPRLSFFFNAHSNFPMPSRKFGAARHVSGRAG